MKHQSEKPLSLRCLNPNDINSFELIRLDLLSGDKCNIYSVRLNDEMDTLFEQFLKKYADVFRDEVLDIYTRLKAIGKSVGLRNGFYKEHEGKPGDGVCALYDMPNSHLRVYFIRYGADLIVVGDGGEKPKNIRTWQENKVLSNANMLMQWVSNKIKDATDNKDIRITDNGFEGELKIEPDN